MAAAPIHAQSLLAPRVMSAGAPGAAVRDTRGFDVNPAGLTGMRDWDLTLSGFTAAPGDGGGAVFHAIALGKKFLDRHALAVQYTPGTKLEFIVPTTVFIGVPTPLAGDLDIAYSELFTAAYAVSPLAGFSAGVQVRWRETEIAETRFELRELDTTAVIVPSEQVSRTSAWLGDAGAIWKPSPGVTLSAVARNILEVRGAGMPEAYAPYALNHTAEAEVGAEVTVRDGVTMAAGFTTREEGTVGLAVAPVPGLAVRAGAHVSTNTSPFVTAVSAGIGWSAEFLEIDAGYIRFLSREGRTGSVPASGFNPAQIRAIDLHPYTADRIAVSIRALVGSEREQLVRIEAVDITGGVYPSSSGILADRPLGKVTVRNVSGKPVQARAAFLVERFMDAPTESRPVYLLPGETAEISLNAVFNDRLHDLRQMTVREGTVTVSAEPAERYDDRRQARVLLHGRNDWDGDVHSLRYFVTPNDPDVIRTARELLMERQDSAAAAPAGLLALRRTRILLDAFAGRLLYVGDPKQSADYVQYPSETLGIRGGDCDDLTVCFSSLLNSIGISTAFIDVIPPERPGDAHIYLLVDTGVEPQYGSGISSNPKRYVIRRDSTGKETVWIPIESTALREGFEGAWSAGAQRYFDDVEIGLGTVRGWVRIVDVY